MRGDVACRKKTCWKRCLLQNSNRASSDDAVSVAVSGERGMMVTCLLCSLSTQSLIFLQSVETYTCSMQSVCSAASMVHDISGLPAMGLIFLRGIDLLPPRAGINATIFLGGLSFISMFL